MARKGALGDGIDGRRVEQFSAVVGRSGVPDLAVQQDALGYTYMVD